MVTLFQTQKLSLILEAIHLKTAINAVFYVKFYEKLLWKTIQNKRIAGFISEDVLIHGKAVSWAPRMDSWNTRHYVFGHTGS